MKRVNQAAVQGQADDGQDQPPSSSVSLVRWALPLILTLYLIFGTVHAFNTPTGATGYQDAPDEAAHISVLQTFASGHMPTQHSPHAGVTSGYPDYEWHQPPLYYAIAVPFLMAGERAVRILTLVIGLFSLLLIYATARLIRPDDELIAITAVGIAALIPAHIAILSAANNDALLEVCFSAAIYLIALSLKQSSGTSIKNAVLLGACLGAALLTKTTAIVLVPVMLVAAYLNIKAGAAKQIVIKHTAISFGVAIAISGWWFVRNAVLYGQLLPLRGFATAFAGTKQAADVANRLHGWPQYWALVTQWCFKSFWAVYGTRGSARDGIPMFLPDSVYLLMLAVIVAAIAGMVKLHFRQKELFTTGTRFGFYLMLMTLGLVTAAYILFVSKYFQTQGRYLYPAMSAICLTLSMGWLELFPAKYKRGAAGGLLALLGLVCVAFLLQTSGRQ